MNPYTEMLSVMRQQGSMDNTPGCMMGVVTGIDPLKVTVAGLELDKDDLLSVEWYTTEWEREWEITEGPVLGTVKLKPAKAHWQKGDKLLLMPESSEQAGFQRFFILAKLAEVE